MEKTKETITKELRNLFEIGKEGNHSYEVNGSFGIHKNEMERHDVIEKLKKYFQYVTVEGGYVEVRPITLVFTSFKIKQFEEDEKSSD